MANFISNFFSRKSGMQVVASMGFTHFESDNDPMRAYKTNSVVQSCVNILCGSFQEADLRAVDGNKQAVPNRFWDDIIKMPNPTMDESAFERLVLFYMLTTGNCYIHKLRNGRRVVGLMPYSGKIMSPVFNAQGAIVSYQYYSANNMIDVAPEDVIHCRYPLPDSANPNLGLSPIASIVREAATDTELTRFMNDVLKNDALPRTLLTFPQGATVNQQLRDMIKEDFSDRYSGEKRGSVAVLTNGVTVSRLSMNLNELETETLRSVLEARICAALRVPPVLIGVNVGLQNSTYNNMQTARKDFTERTLQPLWNVVADAFTMGLQSDFAGIRLAFDTKHIGAMQDDKEALANRVVALYQAGVITLEEARKELGKDASVVVPKPGVVQQPQAKSALDEIEEKKKKWERYDGVATRASEKMTVEITTTLLKLKKELLSNVKAFNIADWGARFEAATAQTRVALIQELIRMAATDAAFNWNDVSSWFDQAQSEAIRASAEKIKQAVETIRKEMQQLLQDLAGQPPEVIKEQIEQRFSMYLGARAAMIARTTATATTGAAQSATWRTLNQRRTDGKRIVKLWLTQRDTLVRDAHAVIDGQQRELDEQFELSGKNGVERTNHPAGDGLSAGNAVNCRCVLDARTI